MLEREPERSEELAQTPESKEGNSWLVFEKLRSHIRVLSAMASCLPREGNSNVSYT
jgi:hypothetical protein